MKYMGSKNRIAKHILPIMEEYRKPNQYWVEPFVGGANLIDKVKGKRIGADLNHYLIALLKKMQEENFEAPLIDKETYYKIKENKEQYEDWLVGFAGFQLSYGATWFSSYRSDNQGKRDYAMEAKKNIDKQSKNIKDIEFYNCSYQDLIIPEKSIIYCDPPYQKVGKYNAVNEFNHDFFFDWCLKMKDKGHTIFLSEYNAPDYFECIWEKEIVSAVRKSKNKPLKKGIEKLYILKGDK